MLEQGFGDGANQARMPRDGEMQCRCVVQSTEHTEKTVLTVNGSAIGAGVLKLHRVVFESYKVVLPNGKFERYTSGVRLSESRPSDRYDYYL